MGFQITSGGCFYLPWFIRKPWSEESGGQGSLPSPTLLFMHLPEGKVALLQTVPLKLHLQL